MIVADKVISKDCRVSKENIDNFNSFIMENLFKELPSDSTCELTSVFTTFSYLQHRYIIKTSKSNKVLSIILRANYLGKDKVFKDYLKCDFVFLNENMDKQLTCVRIFENNFDEFKKTFYKEVLPMFQ